VAAPQLRTTPIIAPLQAVIIAPAAPAAAPAAVSAPAKEISAIPIDIRVPSYPIESRRRHEQGTVVLLVALQANGRVQDVSVYKSSGSPRLDQAAREAVRRWRWAPGIEGGTVPIPFVLKA
jgi:protein TonB